MFVTVPLKRAPIGYLASIADHGIGLQLLHAEADALRLRVDADDLHLDRVADVQDLGRMVDAAPSHVGDVQQAVDAAEVDERAVVGDVLDQAVDDLALGEAGDDVGALLGARLLEHGAARDDDVAAAAVHLQDLERLLLMHQRADVAHGADVDLRARKERHGAVEIDREAALDLVEDDARHLLALLVQLLEAGPALLAARLVAREHGFTERVLDALEVNFHRVADLEVLGLPAMPNSLSGTRPSILRPTSMTARSFSMPTILPLTTLPSKTSSLARLSASRAANSSRVGFISLLVLRCSFVLLDECV